MRRFKEIIVPNLYKSSKRLMMNTMRRKEKWIIKMLVLVKKKVALARIKAREVTDLKMRRELITWNDLNCTVLLFFHNKNLFIL
jgi:hypothetical protein